MITLAYFRSLIDGSLMNDLNGGAVVNTPDGVTVTKGITLPTTAPEAGWYPSAYSMSYDANSDKVRVTLLNMVELPATSS